MLQASAVDCARFGSRAAIAVSSTSSTSSTGSTTATLAMRDAAISPRRIMRADASNARPNGLPSGRRVTEHSEHDATGRVVVRDRDVAKADRLAHRPERLGLLDRPTMTGEA